MLLRTALRSAKFARTAAVQAQFPALASPFPKAGINVAFERAFSGSRPAAVGNFGARQLPTTFNLPDPSNGIPSPFQLTKIVATIGPTSEQLDPMREVVRAGMKIMRLNFSHATIEEVELRTKNLALCQDKATHSGHVEADQDVRATLLDTRGPEVRSGKLMKDDSGHETITLCKGDLITLQTSDKYRDEGSTETDLYINYSKLHECMSPGMKVLLDDGAVILTVTGVDKASGSVQCIIDNTGELRSRAGVNLPMAETDLPAMSEKDKADIKYGLEIDVDYVAASFIQSPEGVREIRDYMKTVAAELGWEESRPLPKIISKIESASALKHFDEILTESDGIMVARGDLGVEIPIQQVTNAQKEMVAACNAVGKPVIVATQMLESMAKNPRPTRAEVSDVTNAVYDGADAVMLSGETAKGKYPSVAVSTMNEIILGAEHYANSGALGAIFVQKQANGNTTLFDGPTETRAAVAKAAVVASQTADTKAIIVVAGEDERVASFVAAYKPKVPVVVFCPSAKMARRLILHRGIYPVVGLSGASSDEKVSIAMQEATQMGYVANGDQVVVVSYDSESPGSATCLLSTVSN